MSEVDFKPLFDYLDDFKAEVKADVQAIDEKVAHLQDSVDGLVKIVKDFQDEHIILRHQFEIFKVWAKQVSEKVGVPLPH